MKRLLTILILAAALALLLWGCFQERKATDAVEPGYTQSTLLDFDDVEFDALRVNPCNLAGGDTLAIFGLPSGQAHLLSYSHSETTGQLNLFVRWPDAQECRTIVIYPHVEGSSWWGYTAKIVEGTTTTFLFDILWSQTNNGHAKQYEDNGVDDLMVESWVLQNGLTREEYTYNSVKESWEFDPETLDPEDPIKDEFFAHYPLNSSLNGDVDGQRLLELINSDDFVNWLGSEFGQWSSAPKSLWGVCAFFKCTMGGGVANPICHVCTGVGLAVEIAGFICENWADCD